MINRRFAGIAFFILSTAGLLFLAGMEQQASAQTLFSEELTLQQTTTSPAMMGQPPRSVNSTVYFSRNAMKSVGAEGTDSLVRFDQGKIITINNKKKTYSEITPAQIQELMDKAAGSANKEQMEMMKKMMGQVSDTVTVTKEGPGEKIAGYDTVKYHITGMMDLEMHAAPDLKVPGLYYDAMKLHMPNNPFLDMGKLIEQYKKIEGLPLKTVMTIKMMNTEMKSTTIVTSVAKGPIAASIFEVPAGYKLVAAELGK
jgi:hypothetical protein